MSLSVSLDPEATKAAQPSSTSLIEPLPVKQGLSSTLAADPGQAAAAAPGSDGSAGIRTGGFARSAGACGSWANAGETKPAASASVATIIAARGATGLRPDTCIFFLLDREFLKFGLVKASRGPCVN